MNAEYTARETVWLELAEHFLDTDTRARVPISALVCIQASLTGAAVRSIWRYEVTPALCGNLEAVAGEWAAWDADWLVQRIESQRGRRWNRPGLIGELVYKRRARSLPGRGRAIEAAIDDLSKMREAERARSAAALQLLMEVYFDFDRDPAAAEAQGWNRDDLRRLFEEQAVPLLDCLETQRAGPRELQRARVIEFLRGVGA